MDERAQYRRSARGGRARGRARRDPLRRRPLQLLARRGALDGIDLVAPAARRRRSSGARGPASRPCSRSCRGSTTSTGGAVADRRQGRARRDAGQPARPRSRSSARSGSVRRHRAGEHRLRPAGRERRGDRAAAKAAAAHDFIARLPQGYDSASATAAIAYPGGERQRLALARAFLEGRADPGARRGDERARLGIRAPRPGRRSRD